MRFLRSLIVFPLKVFRPLIRFFCLGTAVLCTIGLPIALLAGPEHPIMPTWFIVLYGAVSYAIAYGYDTIINWIDPNT